MGLIESLPIDLGGVASHLWKLALSFFLVMPIAWDREREERSLGLRTFPLVAMASTAYILIASSIFGGQGASELARIIQGLLTGIGFLGGGAIVKRGFTVHGTATAASIWSTAAIGLAVAVDRFEIAVALTLANFLTLRYLKSLKDVVAEDELDD
jgi:putative Mg2+ transporter-C (MgtC) family protein